MWIHQKAALGACMVNRTSARQTMMLFGEKNCSMQLLMSTVTCGGAMSKVKCDVITVLWHVVHVDFKVLVRACYFSNLISYLSSLFQLNTRCVYHLSSCIVYVKCDLTKSQIKVIYNVIIKVIIINTIICRIKTSVNALGKAQMDVKTLLSSLFV